MKERDIIMQINKVNSANQPSFKGIVSKGFLKHMKKEVQEYVKQGDEEKVRKIVDLFKKVEAKTKPFDVEVIAPVPKSRDGELKIIPNKTVVWLSSTEPVVKFKVNEKHNKRLAGYEVYSDSLWARLPHKEILANGWATGVGYLTSNTKYPDSASVLEEILSNVDTAMGDFKKIAMGIASDFINKLDKAIEKAK